jgi:hypothetical protein
LQGFFEMQVIGALIAICGFCGFFAFAPSVVDPGAGRAAVVRSRYAAIFGSVASLAIMAVGTHV